MIEVEGRDRRVEIVERQAQLVGDPGRAEGDPRIRRPLVAAAVCRGPTCAQRGLEVVDGCPGRAAVVRDARKEPA